MRTLADDKLNSFPYHAVPTCWRRLYTDAVLYGTVARLAHLANLKNEVNATQLLLQIIGRLDAAIVISGSPGPMRLELAQSLISLAQQRLAVAGAPPEPVEATSLRQVDDEDGRERPAKRLCTTKRDRSSSSSPSSPSEQAHSATTEPRPSPPPYIHIPLRELASLPTFLDPAHNPLHREPFIVRRGAAHFPAFDDPDPDSPPRPFNEGDGDGVSANEGREAENHNDETRPRRRRRRRSRWSDLAYLRQLAGPGRIVPVEVGGDYTQSGWGQRMMPFDEFLESLEVVEERGTGREEEEDGASAASRRGRREVPTCSLGGDDDDEGIEGPGGGGGSNGSTMRFCSTTRAAVGSKSRETDADREGQSSSPPSTTTTAAAAAAAAVEPAPARPIYYLAQHSLFRQFPALVSDLLIPDLVYSPPEQHYPSPSFTSNTSNETSSYEPPKSEEGYVLNAWLGPGGTKSAAHTDPWWNCYGARLLFFLFPFSSHSIAFVFSRLFGQY